MSREISAGVNLDYDKNGEIVGIDIDNATQKLDMKELFLNHVAGMVHIQPV